MIKACKDYFQIKTTLVLMTLLFITACGYHLRANVDLPEGYDQIYFQGGSSRLKKIIKKHLRSTNGKLVENPKEASVIVKVMKEKLDRKVLSVNSRGRANEYELNYILDFMLLDVEGNELSNLQNIEINRDYFNDQEDVLGKNNEEIIIKDEMYRQAVQSVFRRTRITLEQVSSLQSKEKIP